MIREINKKDFFNFLYYCKRYDKFKDFYVLQNNKKNFLNDFKIASKIFNNCLKSTGRCFIKESNSEIKGLFIIYKEDKKNILKILTNSKKDLIDLLQYLSWNYNQDLFIKCKVFNRFLVYNKKQDNLIEPIFALQKYNFKILEIKNNEVLMKGTFKERKRHVNN